MYLAQDRVMKKILVVEDDPGIASLISRSLEQEGYVVRVEPNGATGLEVARSESFDLIVLDVMLPGKTGIEFAEEFRRGSRTTPILMLTARDAIEDRVKGLDSGADDYLTKPFDIAELFARCRAQIRREQVNRVRLIRVADLEIETVTRKVTRGGKPIELTRREFDLLEALAANEGRVLTREVIQTSVWADSDSFSNSVDVYIGFLRKKVDGGFSNKLIHTVRSLGYCLENRGGSGAK